MSSRVNKKVSFNKSQLVLAAKKPLHSIVETRPGNGVPEEDFEEELYNAEIDPAKDPQEQVEQCLLIEGKRSAELRTEELVLALMEMVKQDNHRQLGAKVEQMQLVEKHEQENTMSRVQHGLPSVIFYWNNEGRRSSIRCTFDPGGMARQSFCFQLSLLLRDSHLEDKVDFNRGGVDTLIIPYSSIII